MAAHTIKFEIVTPEQVVLQTEVLRATIPTEMGEVTILPNHTPLISNLKSGVIEIEKPDKQLDFLVVSGGFLEVFSSKIVILADYAERAANLDEKLIEAARAKAEQAKLEAKNEDEVEFADVSAKLEMELFKTKALSRWRRIKRLDK